MRIGLRSGSSGLRRERGGGRLQSRRLFEFEGYGGADPRVFFIGLEEHSGDDEENLRQRCLFDRRMDLRRAHDLLFGPAWWSWGSARVLVWQVAAQIRAALELGAADGPEFERAWRYTRAELLGRDRVKADTLLTELLPVPTNRNRTWPEGYQKLLGYESYEAYRSEQLPLRKELLRELVRTHRPSHVFCYGSSDWDDFKTLFPNVPAAGWRAFETAPARGGQPQAFQVARDGDTVVALTLHFGGRGRRFSRQHIVSVLDALRNLAG